MQQDPIIQMRDVSFTYAGAPAPSLEHVTLGVGAGEFVGVVGPSGAGKSTLAAAMSGAIPHHFSGELYGATLVCGRDTCESSLTDISRVVGSVLQDIDAQMVSSVVEDEMLFGLENFGVPHDEIPGRVEEALSTVGAAALRHREISTLSGGQKQKVAIAAILALRPRALVLDEPTAALDPASSELVFETLRRVREREGIAVVVIEQKVALLAEHCDRVVVMSGGRVELDGAPREVFAHAAELRAMGVDSPRVARVTNSLVEKGLLAPGTPPSLTGAEAHDAVAALLAPKKPGGASAASGLRPAPGRSPHVPASRPHAEGAEPVVRLEGVGFSYAGTGDGVSGVDMSVYPGELVGVIGQNGAGKTTLTKLLNGLLRPAAGRVLMAGMDTRTTPISTLAREVSTLFQNPDRQLCKNTVIDEVAFGPELHGVAREEALARAGRVVERFGLPADESPFVLSRGQRQMVALASVVVMEPRVVLLDEPTAGLDYRECMTVMDTVRELAERGCAVVMVCHDMEVVSDFAERVLVMADGRVVGRGPTDEVFAQGDLLARASLRAPEVARLSAALAADVDARLGGRTQVGDLVDAIGEMVRNG